MRICAVIVVSPFNQNSRSLSPDHPKCSIRDVIPVVPMNRVVRSKQGNSESNQPIFSVSRGKNTRRRGLGQAVVGASSID